MKNATREDVTKAQKQGYLDPGIMYQLSCGTQIHYKDVDPCIVRTLRESRGYVKDVVVCERIDGQVTTANLRCLVVKKARGPSHTPKKPKRKPIKGTKPWTKIPYKFEDVEVGDVVEYESLGRKYSHKVKEKGSRYWSAEDGAGTGNGWKGDTAHILKPYKEPVKKEEEEVYQLGDVFNIEGYGFTKFILAQVDGGVAKLINTHNGNRLSDKEIYCLYTSITTDKIKDYLGGRTFTKVYTK